MVLGIGLLLAGMPLFAQGDDWLALHPRPLEQARLFLENLYEKPVTYEDPVWRWIGDSTALGTDPEGPMGRWLWDRHLDLPPSLTRAVKPRLRPRFDPKRH